VTELELSILAEYYKRLKLAKIWRAIARRRAEQLSFFRAAIVASPWPWVNGYVDGETDP
jgi:hypothetical protein